MSLTGGGDTMATHVGASMVSGLVTTTLTAPVDVIKTNMFVGELLITMYSTVGRTAFHLLIDLLQPCFTDFNCYDYLVRYMLKTYTTTDYAFRIVGFAWGTRQECQQFCYWTPQAILLIHSIHRYMSALAMSVISQGKCCLLKMLLVVKNSPAIQWRRGLKVSESCDISQILGSVGGKKFSGPLQCASDILAREGARGLLKGWTANYIRLGPQTTVVFVVLEKLRQWHGLEGF